MECRALLPREVRVDMGPLGELSLEMELSETHRRIAREELRETDDVVPNAIAALGCRLQEEKDLVLPLDDELLTTYLRPCHWDPDTAFEKVRNFFSFKARHPKVGRPLPLARVEPIAAQGVICIMPRRDQFGRRILLLHTGRKWDPKKMSMEELLCAVLMCLEMALLEPNTQVSGVVIVWDLDGLTLSQVFKFTPSFAKMLLHLVQDCVPMRIKAFHFVNQPNIFQIAFNIIKPLLNDKLRSRLHIHGKNATLTAHVDPKVLPKQYGGEHELIYDADAHSAAFHSLEKYFEEMTKFGYSKPPK